MWILCWTVLSHKINSSGPPEWDPHTSWSQWILQGIQAPIAASQSHGWPGGMNRYTLSPSHHRCYLRTIDGSSISNCPCCVTGHFWLLTSYISCVMQFFQWKCFINSVTTTIDHGYIQYPTYRGWKGCVWWLYIQGTHKGASNDWNSTEIMCMGGRSVNWQKNDWL